MSFNKLKLIDPLLKAIEERGYKEATFIQKKAIPQILQRKNVMGIAKTGAGKTAAYSIPVVQLIHRIDKKSTGKPTLRALVVTPNDKLSLQAGKSFSDYAKHTIVKHAVLTNHKDTAQINLLNEGVNVLVSNCNEIEALKNLNQGTFKDIKILVLDEFDEMLNGSSKEYIQTMLGIFPVGIQTICFTGKVDDDIDALLKQRLEGAEKFEVKPRPKKGTKQKKKSDKPRSGNPNAPKGDAKKKKKKKKGGGGRKSTEMSAKLKAKFLWPLEK